MERLSDRFKHAWHLLRDEKFSTLAGSLVFFLTLSLMPFVFWLVLLFGKSGLDAEYIFELELFGWAKELVLFFRENAEGAATGVSIFFLAATLWSSTGFFYHLRRIGEIIYRVPRGRGGWHVRVAAAAFTLLLLVGVGIAGLVLVGSVYVAGGLPRPFFVIILYSLVFTFGFALACALNLYLCPRRCTLSALLPGSLFTSVSWLIASAAFNVYLLFSNPERLYGALSLIIIFLLWMYWMMICLVAGAIFNAARLRSIPALNARER